MESFNPQVLPSSLPRKDHHKTALISIWAAVAAIIIGLLYWWIASPREPVAPTVVNTPTQTERSDFAQIRSEIDGAPSREVSTAEAAQIRKQSSSPPRKLGPQEEAEIRQQMGYVNEI